MIRSLFLLITTSVFLILSGVSPAEESSDREYSIKAVFLYNFTKFIRWPDNSVPDYNQDGLRLCVVGDNPFGNILAQLAEKVSAKGKKLTLKQPSISMEMGSCHVLFVSSSEKKHLARILETVKNSPVLVVGDTPGFVEMGVGVNFYIQDNKIRFKANKEAIERSGLKVSSELLGLAEMGGGAK
jgi:hypothetical protein